MMDLYARQIIGWSMSERDDTKLLTDALSMSISHRGKADKVIVHSDQGSTYASGECHDNAVAESFFGTLKTELVDDYLTRAAAKQSLFNYIEVFYNRQRRHSYLGYTNPVEFERATTP